MHIYQMHNMLRGNHFHAFALRDEASSLLDPFIGVDHAWMSAPTFPAHQHVGISAVSYAFLDSETDIENRDSLGNHNFIRPGGLHWAMAGCGITHQEDPAETGKTVHQLQIFVKLDAEHNNLPPLALILEPEDIPVVRENGAEVRVVLGKYGQVYSPIKPPTIVNVWDISLQSGAELQIMIEAGHNAFVMSIAGMLLINDQIFKFDEHSLPVFSAQTESQMVTLKTDIQNNSQVVVFTGRPLG